MKKIISVVLLLILFSLKCFAQEQNEEFIKDKISGCLVKNGSGSADIIAIWTGGCKDGYADGEGTLTWFEGDKIVAEYTGTMEKGIAHGKGKYVMHGWGTMEGNFVNEVLQGQGKMVFENGGKIEGNFVDGSLLDLDEPYFKELQKTELNFTDTTGIYRQEANLKTLFYYTLAPKEIKGTMILLPSTNEAAENVISCNKKLMQKCYDNNILSVVLSINANKGLESDPAAMNFLETCFSEIIKKYNAPANKIILNGFSLGGETALMYTEMSRNPEYITVIKPLAVIGVDPPVDMENLYRKAKDEIEQYSKDSITEGKQWALNEDHFILDYFTHLYGGSPEQFPEKYVNGSMFSRSQKDGGNAKYLWDVPVMIYCDPDIEWALKNRNRDFYDMNAADLSAMINFLQINGNKQAEFISALGKGYRIDGRRHPHSWSIIDADRCVEWMLQLIN
jgi:hypothetical protein